MTAVGRALLVTNTNDSGAGSLRQAILDSNADSGDVDRISFNILGAGLHTIAPSTALPAMTQPAIIDGTTQPGFAGTPIIELSGANIATTVAGLAVNSPSGGAIKGLVVNRFRGAGITVSGPGITISGNYVGTTTSGTAAAGNFYGISLLDSSNNVIGGATAGTGNLISGNTSVGIVVTKSGGSGSNNNQIVGNLIGTDVTGTLPVPNATGVDIFDSSNNRIGGTTAPERNVVSGNTQNGVTIEGNATGTLVQGNYVGTTAGGDQILANGGAGISIASPGVTIGGTTSGAGNAISGNNGGGIVVDTASSNALVQGNTIGPNAALTAVLGNQSNGVFIRSSISGTTIGGTAAGAGNVIAGSQLADISVGGTNTTIQGNTISTNPAGTVSWSRGSGGISLASTASNTQIGGSATGARNVITGTIANHTGSAVFVAGTNNRIEGNYIGVNAAGAASVGNGGAGVGFDAAAQSNFVGNFTTGTGNVIAGSFFNGVSVSGINNSVLSNRIGTNAAGTVAIPNGTGGAFGGVIVNAGARGTLVGFINNAGNLISGNNAYGLFVDGDQTQVQGNTIGNNLANAVGMIVGTNAHSLLLGGEDTGTPNLISGNTGIGVSILAGSPGGYVVEGNTIVGNGSHGISIGSPNNRIGGVIQFMENVISGNGGSGILISGPTATGNIVQRNYIGTNSNGTVANPNRGVQSGIFIQGASNNTVGGTTAEAANVVSGNTQHAITICCDSSASGNLILGNFVGTRRDGITPLGNGGIGIDIVSATNTTVGGPGAARNVIANNQTGVQIRTGAAGNVLRNNAIVANTTGVNINDGAVNNTIGGISAGDGNVLQGNGKALYVVNATSVGNAILGNSISGTLIGIDLANDGVTPNDPGDVYTGPNNLQNFPVLTSGTVAGSTLTVLGH